jgi:hypothetical protein
MERSSAQPPPHQSGRQESKQELQFNTNRFWNLKEELSQM